MDNPREGNVKKDKQNSQNLSRSSSEEDQRDDKIIEQLISNYDGASRDLLDKTIALLRENIKPGVCLICIEDIEKREAIWSCSYCFCALHLVCIQHWSQENLKSVKEAAAAKGFNLPLIWCCPKCRGEYSESDFPSKYTCFCGRLTDPPFDPWVNPHSCGSNCQKVLKCGDGCNLLCHSGPCPPCPKQVVTSCHCGGADARSVRCVEKYFTCGKPCDGELPCNHKCPEICHPGNCKACKESISVNCQCYSPSTLNIPCNQLADPQFEISCGKKCGKVLNCGVHECQELCHGGQCSNCFTTCPCGKSRVNCMGLRGSRASGKPCENRCGKPLDCSIHNCEIKCHLESCGTCLAMILKRCPCGASEKEVNCSKEYTCTNKCRRLKDCGIHSCNKKCCKGDCGECESKCGKLLNCKNHKCMRFCHRGLCYPCSSKIPIKCRCGATTKLVNCGSERKAIPPPCKELCNRSSKCDHPRIQMHACHFMDCPRCTKICDKDLPSCDHKCPAKCHSFKLNKKECPKCLVLVPSSCPLHSNIMVNCHSVTGQRFICEEICELPLVCGFHKCQKKCHQAIMKECGQCSEPCSLKRPPGCTHQCDLGCHTGSCPGCTLQAKIQCLCGSEELYVICSHQNTLPDSKLCCKNQCPKKLQCGHRCLSPCHRDQCPELERCRRRVKITCKCRHYKAEVDCYLVESKVVDCAPNTCNRAPKTPEMGPNTSGRKRQRKKRTSESKDEGNETDSNQNKDQVSDSDADKSAKLKYMIILGVCIGFISIFYLFLSTYE